MEELTKSEKNARDRELCRFLIKMGKISRKGNVGLTVSYGDIENLRIFIELAESGRLCVSHVMIYESFITVYYASDVMIPSVKKS